jgi:hypothetical protein
MFSFYNFFSILFFYFLGFYFVFLFLYKMFSCCKHGGCVFKITHGAEMFTRLININVIQRNFQGIEKL